LQPGPAVVSESSYCPKASAKRPLTKRHSGRRYAQDGPAKRLPPPDFTTKDLTFAPNGRVLMFFRDPVATADARRLPSTFRGATNSRFRVRSGVVGAAILREASGAEPQSPNLA